MSTQFGRPIESHFERHGDGFLYRRDPGDAPVRVSAAEHDRFIEDYRHAMGRQLMTLLALMIGVPVTLLLLSREVEDPSLLWTLAAVVAIVSFSGWGTYRVLRTPLLSSWRPPAPGTLNYAKEARYPLVARLSYWQLGLAVPYAMFMAALVGRQSDRLYGGGWVVLLIVSAIILPAAVQALRKWSDEEAA